MGRYDSPHALSTIDFIGLLGDAPAPVRMKTSLRSLLRPRSVVIVSAGNDTENLGHTIHSNLIGSGYSGELYSVDLNSEHAITSLAKRPDLAILALPEHVVPEATAQCATKEIPGRLILPASFRFGVMSGHMNATFASTVALPGHVAFLSQSGALCYAVLDWSLKEKVGFSALVSLGSMPEVGWADVLRYFGDDPTTKCIVMYMETLGDPGAFIAAARETALKKPIVVLKSGPIDSASSSAPESDDVVDAAFRRCGVLRVKRIADLFYLADVLGKQPRPAGPRLTIVTNAGGPAALATDALTEVNGSLTPLSSSTVAELRRLLPFNPNPGNPINVLGNTPPERYSEAIRLALEDSYTDGLLAIVTPQGTINPVEIARLLATHPHTGKPILASFMGGNRVEEADRVLSGAGIPSFPYPDSAARVFQYMWQYSSNLRSLYETPVLDEEGLGSISPSVTAVIQGVLARNSTVLSDAESKELLDAYRIPVGIQRGSSQCYELTLGSYVDTRFGPVIFFGIGGALSEIFQDRALGLPPLNSTLARRLIERTRIYEALQGTPIDLDLLERTLVRFSRLIVEQPRIREIEINPLLVSSDGIGAMATKVVLFPASIPDEQLPRTAIRPYPDRYSEDWISRAGDRMRIRPIRPEDEPQMIAFHQTLSDHSVHMRYLAGISYEQRTAHERLTRVCGIDYDHEMALVAEVLDAPQKKGRIAGVGRLVRDVERNTSEFALLISDDFQRRGLGAELLRRLVQIGKDEKLDAIEGWIAPSNMAMQTVSRRLGFDVRLNPDEELVQATLKLT